MSEWRDEKATNAVHAYMEAMHKYEELREVTLGMPLFAEKMIAYDIYIEAQNNLISTVRLRPGYFIRQDESVVQDRFVALEAWVKWVKEQAK